MNNIAVNIKKLLKSYTENKLSKKEASSQFKSLEKSYLEFKNNLNIKESADYLSGLCYHHNIENFSIFTGIYILKNNSISSLSHYGDNSILKKINNVLLKNFDHFEKNKLFTIKPDKINKLKNNLYIFNFNLSDNINFYIVSLSSSNFFDQDKFEFFSYFLKTLIPQSPIQEYNCLDIYKKIENFINNKTKNDATLYAYIYYFPYLDKIIDHLGEQATSEISLNIEKTLTDSYDINLFQQTISLKEYVIFDSNNIDNALVTTNKKIHFYYKDIPIPYYSKIIELKGDNCFYKFTEALFSIANL